MTVYISFSCTMARCLGFHPTIGLLHNPWSREDLWLSFPIIAVHKRFMNASFRFNGKCYKQWLEILNYIQLEVDNACSQNSLSLHAATIRNILSSWSDSSFSVSVIPSAWGSCFTNFICTPTPFSFGQDWASRVRLYYCCSLSAVRRSIHSGKRIKVNDKRWDKRWESDIFTYSDPRLPMRRAKATWTRCFRISMILAVDRAATEGYQTSLKFPFDYMLERRTTYSSTIKI